MPKLDPQASRKKLKEYIDEINKLSKLTFKQGTTKKAELSEKIKALVNVAFDDSKDKLKRYSDIGKFPERVFAELYPSDVDEQYKYLDGLNIMKRQLIGFDEELSLLESSKTTSKLTELEGAIKEKELEAKRRNAVVETKRAGAEIELLTILRDEIKRKDETRKEIVEIKSHLMKIEQMMLDVTKLKQDNQERFEEDKLYDDIVTAAKNRDRDMNILDLVTSSRTDYSEIKGLREEIKILQQQVNMPAKNILERNSITEKISEKSERITKLLKDLAETWGSFQ